MANYTDEEIAVSLERLFPFAAILGGLTPVSVCLEAAKRLRTYHRRRTAASDALERSQKLAYTLEEWEARKRAIKDG